jgi:hypothetical protein
MGKGKRNREWREQAIAAEDLIERLIEIRDRNEFFAFVDEHPEALGEPVVTQLAHLAASPVGTAAKSLKNLVVTARNNREKAWDAYSIELALEEETEQRFERIFDEILEAERQGDRKRVVELTEEAMPQAWEAGLPLDG